MKSFNFVRDRFFNFGTNRPLRRHLSWKERFVKDGVWYFFGALFLANILIWYAVFAEQRNGVLTVAFLDVGQGDSIFIEAPNGNQMLIDGGSNASVLRALGWLMPFYDRSIDVVVATHPDKDHIGGLPAVFERFDIDFFVDPGVPAETGVYQELVQSMEREGSEHIVARRGMDIALSGGAYLHILFPDRDASRMDTNDASIVAKLIYGETSFLLTGDSPQKIENFLAFLDGAALRADVLKVGHHGSKTSSSDLFVGFASPQYSVISAGRGNSYGHPHKEVVERLTRLESAILRTDEAGTIIFKTDGNTVYAQ